MSFKKKVFVKRVRRSPLPSTAVCSSSSSLWLVLAATLPGSPCRVYKTHQLETSCRAITTSNLMLTRWGFHVLLLSSTRRCRESPTVLGLSPPRLGSWLAAQRYASGVPHPRAWIAGCSAVPPGRVLLDHQSRLDAEQVSSVTRASVCKSTLLGIFFQVSSSVLYTEQVWLSTAECRHVISPFSPNSFKTV